MAPAVLWRHLPVVEDNAVLQSSATADCMVSSHAQREADISHWGGVSWLLPLQLAATSRRRRPSVCVLWGRTVGGLGVSKRERREEGGS